MALTILAASGAALYAWLGSNLRAASNLSDTSARAELRLQALEAIEAVNPARQLNGSRRWGQLELTWRGQEVAPMRVGVSSGQASVWRIGLFRLEVRAKDHRSGQVVDFIVLQPGLDRPDAGSPGRKPLNP